MRAPGVPFPVASSPPAAGCRSVERARAARAGVGVRVELGSDHSIRRSRGRDRRRCVPPLRRLAAAPGAVDRADRL